MVLGGSNLIDKNDASTATSAAASSELSFMSSLMANLKPQAPHPGQSTLLSTPTGPSQSPKQANQVLLFLIGSPPFMYVVI